MRSFVAICVNAGNSVILDYGLNALVKSARQQLRDLQTFGTRASHRLVMTSGTSMQKQFEPWYFGVAFAFLFKFCTGMPDMPEWSSQPRHRRDAYAPRIDLETWASVITRRVEQHLKRDWLLGFTMSSVVFRSLLNQCRTVYSYSKVRRDDGSRGFSAEELEQGAISICQALGGKYKDLDGKVKKVNGDFTKLKYAIILSEA